MPRLDGDIIPIIRAFGYQRQGIQAILTATKLDQLLMKLLTTQMPGISKNLTDKIFDYPGSLSSFSAKIDMALALGLIKPHVAQDLHIVRSIRNDFAHAEMDLTFASTQIAKKAKTLRGYVASQDPGAHYIQKTRLAQQAIEMAIREQS